MYTRIRGIKVELSALDAMLKTFHHPEELDKLFFGGRQDRKKNVKIKGYSRTISPCEFPIGWTLAEELKYYYSKTNINSIDWDLEFNRHHPIIVKLPVLPHESLWYKERGN